MKKLYILLFTLLITSISFGQDLIITGVIDGPLPGGFPKGIELYVMNNIADLSVYGLERAANGGASTGTQTFTFPADSYSAGDFIYIGKADAESAAAFSQYLGVTLNYEDDVVNHNGDDTIILYKGGVVVDYFGEVGIDGSGTAWDSVDGWAYRVNGVGPNTTFTIAEWTFSGADALDGCDLADDTGTNAGCASVFPIGAYTLGTASVNRNEIQNFTMYPNPVEDGKLFINTANNSIKKIQIFDVLGKQIFSTYLSGKELNVSKLNSGIYILKIIEEDKTATRKLVIK